MGLWFVGIGIYTVFTLFLGRILFPRVEVKIVHEHAAEDTAQLVADAFKKHRVEDMYLRSSGNPLRR